MTTGKTLSMDVPRGEHPRHGGRKKRILVAPLDWGLGHATRCIPIIRELLQQGAEVILAADRRPGELLKKEFPDVPFVSFPGYDIAYPEQENMAWTMFRQLPKLFAGMVSEHRRLDRIVDTWSIDAVISDNRWMAYSRSVPSVYVVHQLRILLSHRLRWGQAIVDAVNRRLISSYHEVWIPDFDHDENFLGILAPPELRPPRTYFVGPLSRLTPVSGISKELDILAVVSGPEPQRTIFENILLQQLKDAPYRSMLVRGVTEREERQQPSENLTVINSMNAGELSRTMASARTIISRPGYSTIMDLASVGGHAIFVPTPQQTEQEYLAQRLTERRISYSVAQEKFSLDEALSASRQYSGFTGASNTSSVLRERIIHLLSSIA